MNIKQGYWR